jgi:hypothetical protein
MVLSALNNGFDVWTTRHCDILVWTECGRLDRQPHLWVYKSTNTGLPSSCFLPPSFPLLPGHRQRRALSLAVSVALIHHYYLDAIL